jgi:hypothetical protein
MKSLECKQLKHVDGRTGYCLSSRPKNGKVRVIVGKEREEWGQDDVDPISFLSALGLLAEVKR